MSRQRPRSESRPFVRDGQGVIPLTQGYEAIVDVEDLSLVTGRAWHVTFSASGNAYAHRTLKLNGKNHHQKLHRIVLGADPGTFVDHISGDGLDNRRQNLRLVTASENNRNRLEHRNGKLLGVSLDRRSGIYAARLPLGNYPSRAVAEQVLREAAAKLGIDLT